MRKVNSRLTVVLTAVLCAGPGCTSESTVPDVPRPDEPRTAALELANCAVSVPPIVHWRRWEGRTVFDATDPIVMCHVLEMLRARMAARPIRFDVSEDIADLQPAAWDQISHAYLEIVPPCLHHLLVGQGRCCPHVPVCNCVPRCQVALIASA